VTFWLIDEQMDQDIVANRVCARSQDFDRGEAEWDEIWEGVFAILVDRKGGVQRAFGLEPIFDDGQSL
jgi:hypothetical protein